MSDLPYFPFYIGDYLGDTGHLDATEHGAYLLILCDYYKHRQGPKSDPKKLAKIAKLSPKRWQKISETILEFFQIKEGRLWQERAECEIQKMLQTHGILSENGKKGAEVRWGKKNSPAIAPPLAPPSEGQWQSDSESDKHSPLPPQVGESKIAEETPPKNSREHGTNRRAQEARERQRKIDQEDRKWQKDIEEAEAEACTPEESLAAIREIKEKLKGGQASGQEEASGFAPSNGSEKPEEQPAEVGATQEEDW